MSVTTGQAELTLYTRKIVTINRASVSLSSKWQTIIALRLADAE